MGRPKLTAAQKKMRQEDLRAYNRRKQAERRGRASTSEFDQVIHCAECGRPFRATRAFTKFCDGRELGHARNYCQRKAWARELKEKKEAK